MGFQADLEKGEELIYGEIYAPSEKVEPFALGVSNRAIYFAEKKKFAVRDPWVLNRILFAKILSVSLIRTKPYGWWVLAAALIIAGVITSLWMISGWNNPEATRSGIPFGVIAVGVVLPFVLKGRKVLELKTVDKTLRWKPPITVDSAPRKKAAEIQKAFIETCQQVGIHTKSFDK